MKKITAALLAYSSLAHGGLAPLREHIDVNWTYESGEGWTAEAKTEVNGGDVFQDFDTVYLPLDDQPVASGGQRLIQPDLAEFAFTGVAPGEPIWIAPQIQIPGQCWPGFNNYQGAGVFGSYRETDSRLAPEDQALSLPWLRIAFQGMAYQGSGTPSFSLWQTGSTGVPTVWISTAESTTPDVFLMVAGSHIHANWGFGAQGIYRIRLAASAFEGPGNTNPTGTSLPVTLTFAVGPVAQWQATLFDGPELDDRTISGLAADPDRDGMNNLQEYAFGFDPRNGKRIPVAAGLGLPVFSTETEGNSFYHVMKYPRRKADGFTVPTGYFAEFSDLTAAWFPADEEVIVGSLDDGWETVRARRLVLPGKSGFGRVRVVQD